MGARKRLSADKLKEEKKQISFAHLHNCPSSPRKMRLVADLVRGVEVKKALEEAGGDLVKAKEILKALGKKWLAKKLIEK
jgi:ribosomal protein L22